MFQRGQYDQAAYYVEQAAPEARDRRVEGQPHVQGNPRRFRPSHERRPQERRGGGGRRGPEEAGHGHRQGRQRNLHITVTVKGAQYEQRHAVNGQTLFQEDSHTLQKVRQSLLSRQEEDVRLVRFRGDR